MSGRRPRIAFVGLGWIGRHRMEGILDLVEPVAIADPSAETLAAAAALAPDAAQGRTLEEALQTRPDGVVIASPSALHAGQAIAALKAGCAVFCQKPLGRSAAEVRRVVETARSADRLLRVDLSYRGTAALRAMRDTIRSGGIGRVFAAELVFHNAYGPDKPWFYDKTQSGGGPLMDLGIHLVDSALWCLDFPRTSVVAAELYREGACHADAALTEDYAGATLRTEEGATLRIACSWRLHAGRDARIEMQFHGSDGGLSLTNPGGDFYDFEAWLHRGTASERLAAPPDPWGIAMIRAWARDLARTPGFDPQAGEYETLAGIIDAIYATAAGPARSAAVA